MLICGECSARNNDGENFCAKCGAYLVWQRAPAAPEPVPEPRPGPAVTTVPLPIIAAPEIPAPKVSAPDVRPRATPEAVPGPAVAGPRNHRTPEAHLPGGSAGEAREKTGSGHAAAPAVLRRDGPAEVKPGQRVVPDPAQPPPRDEPAPVTGAVICSRCGAGNPPARNFCRRCAAGLREAPVARPAAPWWRRFLSHPRGPALPAGTRPKLRKARRFPTHLASFLAVLGLFGGTAYLGQEEMAAAVSRVQDELKDEEKFAQEMNAPNSVPERGPALAMDRFSNRSWAVADAGSAGAELTAVFGHPFRLTYVVISAGASDNHEVFKKERRPAKVEIIATHPDGEKTTRTVELDDKPIPQSFYVGVDQVSAVTLKILTSWGPEKEPLSVAEVQFAGWP